MFDLVQVSTTTATRDDAEAIANRLLERQLAACVQISGPIVSCYRWQGKLERAEEWLCTAKTLHEAYAHVEAAIRDHHKYDEPEILAVPVLECSPGYAKWVQENVIVPS